MALEQKGVITYIGQPNYYGTQGKYSCEMVIKLPNEKFEQILAIECHNDKCDSVQGLQIGTEVNCHINVTSNHYQGRYYSKVTLWKFEVVNQSGQYANPAVQQPQQATQQSKSNDLPSFSDDEDGLPF